MSADDRTLATSRLVAITLQPEGGGTRVRRTQAFDEAAVCAQVRAICVPANEQNLDRLPAELARGR